MVTKEQEELDARENLGRDIYLLDGDILFASNNDFSFVNFESNLSQAIQDRIKTGINEMTLHQNYGSSIPYIIGDINNDLIIKEIESAINYAMLQEPRVVEITNIEIKPSKTSNDTVEVEMTVQPIGNITELNMIFELFL